MSYQAFSVDPAVAPPWLLQPNGAAWLQAFGHLKDYLAGRSKEAVKARLTALCPTDALATIGTERGIPRGPGETDARYRTRLQAAWTAWQWAGTPYGMLQAFLAAGYGGVTLQTQNAQQFSLDASGDLVISSMAAPVHLGGSPELWSQFAVLILAPWPSWWNGTAPADGSTDQQFAAALVKAWKPAHAQCVGLKVIQGPAWGVNMTWGSFTWGAGTTTVWTPPVN